MAIYHLDNSPLIDQVHVTTMATGTIQATITAKEDADMGALRKLREHFADHNLSSLEDTQDGRAVLELRGIKDQRTLKHLLRSGGQVVDNIRVEETEEDKKKHSFKERVSANSLFLSAIFYDIGNAALITSGVVRGLHNPDGKLNKNDLSEIGVGAAFGIGDILMTIYGKEHGDEQLQAVQEGLEKHLQSKGIKIPSGAALTPEGIHKSGMIPAINDFMHKNIASIKAVAEVAGGLFMVHSGTKAGSFNKGKIAAGLMITTGWATALLLEKPRGHEILSTDKEGPSTLTGKMAANPRGLIATPLAIGNNISNLGGSYFERLNNKNDVLNASNPQELAYAERKQHDYGWNVLTAGSFLIANALYGLSGSKGQNKETDDDKAITKELVLLSSNMLAQQPKEVREAALDQTAEYVSHLAHVDATKDQLKQQLHDKVDALSKSGWVARENNEMIAQSTETPSRV